MSVGLSTRQPLGERNTSVPTRAAGVATKAVPTPPTAATAEPPQEAISGTLHASCTDQYIENSSVYSIIVYTPVYTDAKTNLYMS